MVENLIENAVKYGRQRRPCRLAARPPRRGRRSEPSFPCATTARGIAPEHLPRLTERFYRVDAGASRETGGTGLGLAIVKHIVNRHRGQLAIESTPGEGATFRIVLPEAAEPS